MNSTRQILEQVASDLARAVDASALAALSNDERMQVLRLAGDAQRHLDAVVVETVAAAPGGTGDGSLCAGFGCRSMNELLQRALRVDALGAGRVVKAARVVHREANLSTGGWQPAQWPELREALMDGVIGIAGLLAATGPIDAAHRRIGDEARRRADAELASLARGLVDAAVESDDGVRSEDAAPAGPPATAEDLRLFARVMLAYLDQDGPDPSDDPAMRGRGVRFGREKNGLIPLQGDLLPEVAAQMQRIWNAYLNPKVDGPPLPGVHLAPSDGAGGAEAATDFTGMVDTRSRSQKQHDALAAVLGIAARHDEMPRLGGAAPTLIVSVTAQDYATGRGWARFDGIDTPGSISAAAHTACGGSVQRVLFDPEGRIIGIGVTDRIFTTRQRRAITARDRECLIPGCHVSASWCEIHHVTEHSRGGPTHTDNGVALCWHHHRTLDSSGWEIRMQNGTPQVRGPAWWDPARRWRAPRPRLGLAA